MHQPISHVQFLVMTVLANDISRMAEVPDPHTDLLDGPFHEVPFIGDDQRDEARHETLSMDHDLVDVRRPSINGLDLLRG